MFISYPLKHFVRHVALMSVGVASGAKGNTVPNCVSFIYTIYNLTF